MILFSYSTVALDGAADSSLVCGTVDAVIVFRVENVLLTVHPSPKAPLGRNLCSSFVPSSFALRVGCPQRTNLWGDKQASAKRASPLVPLKNWKFGGKKSPR